MWFRSDSRRLPALLMVAAFAAVAAGCQSGDDAGAISPGTGNGAPEGKVLQSELRAYCPRVTLREGAAVHSAYDKKAEDDPTKLMYQASITAVTRKCSYAPGTISMEIAAAGKVVPGPLFKDGTVSLPMNVVVQTTDGTELYSNSAKYQVSVSSTGGATQFIYTEPLVTFPTPAAGTVQVFAGFVQAPPKKGEEAGL